MPRRNHSSSEARKKISAELNRIQLELNILEGALHSAWSAWLDAWAAEDLTDENQAGDTERNEKGDH